MTIYIYHSPELIGVASVIIIITLLKSLREAIY